MTPVFQIEGLQVRAEGRLVLDVPQLTSSGGLAVVVGPAASGKTLLAAALTGAVASEGRVRVDGQELRGSPSRRRRAGLAAAVRDGDRVAGCTVREALELSAPAGARSREALERIPQLAGRSRVRAELLSGGEQRLLQVACAWCAAGPVLVLDSPTVGLAADAAGVVRALAGEEVAAGRVVLWLEQDLRQAPAPPVAHLVRGRLAHESEPVGPEAGPASPGTAS